MKQDLLQRGYPVKLVQQGIDKATNLSIEELRTPKTVVEEKTCTFVNTHNPNNRNMWGTINSSVDILRANTRCNRLLDSVKMINSKRQPPNLKKLLTRAKFETRTPTVTRCPDKRCGTCDYLITGESYTFKGSATPFRVKMSMNCGTQNVLYVLECQGCMENYIGQTSDMLRSRMRVHKQQIKTPQYRKIPVSKHIADCAGEMEIPFKVFPFYKIIHPDKTFRDVKELSFINKFRPLLNRLTQV